MATMAASQGLPGLPASSVLTWCSSITFHAAKSLFRHHQDHPNPAPLLLPKTILPIGQMLLPLGFLQFDWTQVWFSLEQSWLQGHVCCCQSRTLKLQIDSIGEVISVLVLQVWNTYPLRAWAKWKKKETQNLCDFVKASQSNLRKIHYIVPIQSQVEPRVPYGCSSSWDPDSDSGIVMFAKRVTWDKSASSQYQHFEFLPTFCTPPITSGNFPNRWHLARHQPSCIVKCVSKVSDSSRLCACSRIHAPVTNSQKGKTRLTVLQNEFGEVFPTTSLDIAIMDVSFAPLRKTLKPSEMRLLRAFPGCSLPRLYASWSIEGCGKSSWLFKAL